MGDGIAEGGKNLLSIPFYPTERSSNFILLTDKKYFDHVPSISIYLLK